MVTGEKRFEFRRISEWILSRLMNKDYDTVTFRNGYRKNSPSFTCEFLGWETEINTDQFNYSNGLKVTVYKGDVTICLGKIIKIENYIPG
jgi:hypothetical protein